MLPVVDLIAESAKTTFMCGGHGNAGEYVLSNEPRQKQRSPGSTPHWTVWKIKPRWLITDWLGSVEPAPAGNDIVSSLDQKKFFHTPANASHRGRKRWSLESISPRMWRSLPHWLMADRSEFTGSAPRVADKVPPADQKFFHACNSYSPGTKVAPPRVETTPHSVEPPIPLSDF